MSNWQQIWEGNDVHRLWSIADPEVEQVARRWRQSGRFHRVLDVGCGIGRHVRLLAREGFAAFGTDHSQKAIETCHALLEEEGLSAGLSCGDMGEVLQPDGFFDGAIAFNSIYHGHRERLEAVLGILHARLREGGELFVTLPSVDNRMYGRGERLAPDTFQSPGMFDGLFARAGEKGEPHFFASREVVVQLFRRFEIVSLRHEELSLAKPRGTSGELVWIPVPRAFFWRILARKNGNP